MTKAPTCPVCGHRLQRVYIQMTDEDRHRRLAAIGWACMMPACRYITQDSDDIL
ncbi:MAG TPA: hypothetical protein O0X07_02340 [Methanocorpusculum sp.]|nr:hypothetical protein [Methanocorpusculum sp.]